jgi:hypothetical protein
MSLKDYMVSCLTKYKTLKMKGLWEAPSPEQEQIITLTATVSSLKAKLNRPNKANEKEPSRSPVGTGGNDNDRFKYGGKFQLAGPRQDLLVVHTPPQPDVGTAQPERFPKAVLQSPEVCRNVSRLQEEGRIIWRTYCS